MSAKVNVHIYAHLQGLEPADASIVEGDQQNIDVLIGSDHYFDVVSGDVIRGESGPVAVSSMFGWILSGHKSVEESREKFATTNLIIDVREPIWHSQWDGGEFLKNIHFDEKEGRYEVFLPWKEGHFPASNEYNVCNKVKKAALTIEEKQGIVERLWQCDQGSSQIRDYQSRTRK